MIDSERLEAAVTPPVAARGLALHDVEITGDGRTRVVRITVTREQGIDLDELTDLSRTLDPVVDELVPGPYQLEVSSPGVERRLRRPEHFAAARGERIALKYTHEGSTVRAAGRLVAAEGAAIELLADDGSTHRIPLATIGTARTVFEWGPAPRPGRGSRPGSAKRSTKQHQGGS